MLWLLQAIWQDLELLTGLCVALAGEARLFLRRRLQVLAKDKAMLLQTMQENASLQGIWEKEKCLTLSIHAVFYAFLLFWLKLLKNLLKSLWRLSFREAMPVTDGSCPQS